MSALERWISENARTTAIIVVVAFVAWFASFYRYDLRSDGFYMDRWTGAIYRLNGQCVNCE